MLKRECKGLRLTFHLAGINNQNFIMRDEETGTFWQQISGVAIAGLLAGERLEIISMDELTFGLWKAEQPGGTVLTDLGRDAKEYASKDWDVRMQKMPTVLSFSQGGLKPRDLMLGVAAFGGSRAFPHDRVIKEKLIQDRVGSEPVLLVVGPDGASVRAFRRKLPDVEEAPEFYRLADEGDALMMDSATGSKWNFKGCAVLGKAVGACLERIEVIKDYWFDWRNYHPDTTVFGRKL